MSEVPTRPPLDDRFPRLHWRLDDEAHQAFARFGTIHDVPAGTAIFLEGAPSISFFLVLSGEVGIESHGQELVRVGPDLSFGEMGMLLDLPRAGTATATKPSRLLELSRTDLQAMQDSAPLWSTRLYRVLAESLAEYLHRA